MRARARQWAGALLALAMLCCLIPMAHADDWPADTDPGWQTSGTVKYMVRDHVMYFQPVSGDTGVFGEGRSGNSQPPWGMHPDSGSSSYGNLTAVKARGRLSFLPGTNLHEGFAHETSLRDISGLSHFDVGNVTDMNGLFEDVRGIQDISPLEDWDVSHVTGMGCMFDSAYSIRDWSPLSHWDVSHVTDMFGMFYSTARYADMSALKDWRLNPYAYTGDMLSDQYGGSDHFDLLGIPSASDNGALLLDPQNGADPRTIIRNTADRNTVTTVGRLYDGMRSHPEDYPDKTVWERMVTITLDARGGTVDGKPSETGMHVAGGRIPGGPVEPVRPGYSFQGWQDNYGNRLSRTYPEEDSTYNASWLKVTTVTLDGNGGTFDGGAGKVSDHLVAGGLLDPAERPSRIGYTFKGWGMPDGGPEPLRVPDHDITLKARWERISLPQPALVINGGNYHDRFLQRGRSNRVGAEFRLPYDAPGYTLRIDITHANDAGHPIAAARYENPAAGGYEAWGGVDPGLGAYGADGYGVTVRARLEKSGSGSCLDGVSASRSVPVSPVVTLDADGGRVDGKATDTMLPPAEGTLHGIPALTRDGYEFAGWYAADGTKVDGHTPTPEADTTYTARWREAPHTSSLPSAGGVSPWPLMLMGLALVGAALATVGVMRRRRA